MCAVYSSGMESENVLCQKTPAPFSGKTEMPAYGHTVAPPKQWKMIKSSKSSSQQHLDYIKDDNDKLKCNTTCFWSI